jgi:hypothetical protein
MNRRYLLLLVSFTFFAGFSQAQSNKYKPKIETCDYRFKVDNNFIKGDIHAFQNLFLFDGNAMLSPHHLSRKPRIGAWTGKISYALFCCPENQ